MTRSQEEGEEDQLHKKFQRLQDEWNSYKHSIPRHRRGRSSTTEIASAANLDLLELLHESPKKLVSSLQQNQPPSEVSMPKTGDRRAEDIVTERQAAIKGGKPRERRLLEALESAKEEVQGLHGREEICSVCSSVLIQGCNANSPCSCCSSLLDMHGHNYGKVSLSSSSSAPTSFSIENMERERQVGVKREGRGGGERWMWRMCWLSIVLVFLALCLISLSEFGMEEHGRDMIPT